MQTALARLLEDRLRVLKISRTELAKIVDVTPVSVSKWFREEGDTPIPWRHYPLLASSLDVPLKRILDAAEKDYPEHVATFRRFLFQVRTQLTGQSRRRAG